MTRPRLHRPRGYVLPTVMGALVVIAIVVSQVASRVDRLRGEAVMLQQHAQARQQATSALSLALYFLSTEGNGPAWFGQPPRQVTGDGTPYWLPGGASIALQDQRALLPLSATSQLTIARLLVELGEPDAAAASLADVLMDYADTDSLKRLSGAEAPEYERLGLPPPRNDWLLSVRELGAMPGWRDRPDLLRKLEGLLSVRRTAELNPNLAPLVVLKAALPAAAADQLRNFDIIRESRVFESVEAARAASGLKLDPDTFIFHASDQVAVVVWAPGLPRALQYQVWLTPGDSASPWSVTEFHRVSPPPEPARNAASRRFPIAPGAMRP